MKVSIITIHSIPNCGSALQAYALQAYLQKQYPTFEVEIIDYKFPNEYHFRERARKQGLIKTLRYKLHTFRITYFDKSNRNRLAKFKMFRQEQLFLSNPYCTPAALFTDCPLSDIYITGSDQVWNTKTLCGDASFLFSFVPDNKYRFAYAASFGIDYVHDEYKEIFKKYLSKYASISVREANGCDIIKDLGLCNAQLVCDPTLLLDKKTYEKLILKSSLSLKKDYIVVYYLKYAFNPQPGILKALNEAVDKYQCCVVFIGDKVEGFCGDSLQLNNVGPYDFLKLFSAAKFVVTSSFHGTAFSVIFRKPFVAVASRKGDCRLTDFLKRINLEECIVYNDQNSITLSDNFYNDSFEILFDRYITSSKLFIEDNISRYYKECAENKN